jgi:hypothetical protein
VLIHATSLSYQVALWLLGTFIVVAMLVTWRVQLHRVRVRERVAREIEHTLVQNTQALILEKLLDSADEQLSEVCDRVQDLRMRRDRHEP